MEFSSSPLNPEARTFVPSPRLAAPPPVFPPAGGLAPLAGPPLVFAAAGPPVAGAPFGCAASRPFPRRPQPGNTWEQMVFEQQKLARRGGSGGYSPPPPHYQQPPSQYQMSPPPPQHQYHHSLPTLEGWYPANMAQQQQHYQMTPAAQPTDSAPFSYQVPVVMRPPGAHYQANHPAPSVFQQSPFVDQVPMEPVYVYQPQHQQQQQHYQQAAMEAVYHYQPSAVVQPERGHWPGEYQANAPLPRGPRRLTDPRDRQQITDDTSRQRPSTMEPALANETRSQRKSRRHREERLRDTGYRRTDFPHASPGYEGYIINNTMPRPPSDRPLASLEESPRGARPTIRLPRMAHSRTAYATGNPQQQSGATAAHNPSTTFQPSGSRAHGAEHPNRGNFSFGGAPAPSHNATVPAAPRLRTANLDFAPAPAQAHNATAVLPTQPQSTTTMALRPAQARTFTSFAPAQVHDATASRPVQEQASMSSAPPQIHKTTTAMPRAPRRPTAEELSFGPGPLSSPIQTYIFPGQPTTRLGQPIDLPGPRTKPLAASDTLVATAAASGVSVPSRDKINAGNLQQQTLSSELDNQARTAAAAARGEITYMDNGRYGGELRAYQLAAEQRAAQRRQAGQLREDEEVDGTGRAKVRAWDLKEWKVAGEGKGEGRRGRRYSKSEGGEPNN